MADKEFKLLGFNFTKISAEKNPLFEGKIPEMKSDINILNIEKHKLPLLQEESLKISFSFSLFFGELGEIKLFGHLLIILDEKTKKEVIEEWKNKKLPKDIRSIILNIILQKSSLRAIKIEEELDLPLHIQLPRLQIQEEPKEPKEDKK